MNNPASFTAYLRDYIQSDDAIADFADDWLADPKRPRGRYGWNAIATHLRASGATAETITTARLAWEEYRLYQSPAYILPMLLEQSGILHPSCIYTYQKDQFGVETKVPTPAMNDVIRKLKRSIASYLASENAGQAGQG